MQRSAVTAWQELSELYEQSEGLEGAALQAWLAGPGIAGHAQLEALKRMLAAREHLRDSDFLNAPPRLGDEPAAGVETQGLRVGVPIGPYRLLAPLGAGGMAEVWLAERSDGAFQRRVAIKLMFRQVGGAARDSVAQRFARERDILASLAHPHIAALHDAGVTPGGQPWLALEYVEGRPLTDWCDHARLSIVERVRLYRQVLQAVQHAHAKLVMHRDLKPANILVGEGGQVHLLDFGIAKLLEPGEGAQADTELTRAAGRMLTPLYASPEQLRGEPLTIACDVYALGVVLYELLSGERPYEVKAGSAVRLEQAILESDPRAPSRRALSQEAAERRGLTVKALRKALAGDLDAIVLQALAKRPAQRYASAEAMLADIDRWLEGEPVKAHAPSAVYRWGKFVRRNRLAVGLGSGAVLALAGVAAVAVIQGQQAQRESARAVAARDFMIDMFRRADPEKARGASITAGELLANGRKDVSQRLAHQPELQIEMLQAIASIQSDMGEYVNADTTFDEVARALEQRPDARAAAFARAAHAENVYQLGDHPRALGLITQARRSAAKARADDELTARLAWVEAWIRTGQREPDLARGLFEQSVQHYTTALGPNHIKTIEALQGLSQTAADRKDFDQALSIQDDIALRAARSGMPAGREDMLIRYARATMQYRAGRYLTAFRQAEAATTECAATLGLHDELCRLLANNKIHAALRLGWVDRMRSDITALQAAARDALSPERRAYAAQLLCRVLGVLDPLAVDGELERQLRSIGDSDDEVALSADSKSAALLALADWQLHAGRPASAQREVERVLNAGRQDASAAELAWGRTLLGVAFLQQGQFETALRWFDQASVDHQRLWGPDHTMTLMFSLNRAIALHGLGRNEEAVDIVRRAQPVMLAAMGEDAPTYRRLQQLQRRLTGAALGGPHAQARPGSGGSTPVPPPGDLFFI